ncbi:MAG: hypothetical protein P1Q69_07765 [Candidatus Thorarchaeota archaeon]|nr:hypothetical protein [Candidatus Thorarchaeota archaeon]
MNWNTLYPGKCHAFDRESNSRIPSVTYEDFPQFTSAFASLGVESGTAQQGKTWSLREYPDMFVYYYQTRDSNNNNLQISMLSIVGTNSEPIDIFLATPEALAYAEAPIISNEIVNYLENISKVIQKGAELQIPSTRRKNEFSTIDFGLVVNYNSARNRGPLWGVGEYGTSPTSFRYQLDRMIQSIKDLQELAKTLKNQPSRNTLLKAKRTEKRFRKSYNLLLSMPFWAKDNEHDGISRGAVRGKMKVLATRIEKILGLSSRRLGMGVAEQVSIGLNEVAMFSGEYGGGVPISRKWDDKTRMGTFKHLSSSHRLCYEELASHNLLHKDAAFSGIWKGYDEAIWVPVPIAAPRGPSFFDSQLASDERTLLLNVENGTNNRIIINGGLILDILSKKNPHKSFGEKHLRIYDNTSLVLSSTYTRGGAFFEYDTRVSNRNSVLTNSEIVALAISRYVRAEEQFIQSGHIQEGEGNQRSVYISETRRIWLNVICRILPNLDPQRLEVLLSSAETIFSDSLNKEGSRIILDSNLELLGKTIVRLTGSKRQHSKLESVMKILQQS